MTQYRNRHVNRLAKYQMLESADALDAAVILFPRPALRRLVFSARRIAVLRCYMCGKRHLVQPYSKAWDGGPMRPGSGGLHCVYGWVWGVTHLPEYVWNTLLQGED